MQRKFRTMDFAKNRTEFAKEHERKRELLFLELQGATEAKGGLFQKIIHAITKRPFFMWN